MAHKFLRDDGWFQFPTPVDIGISTSTSTGILNFASATSMSTSALATTPTTGVTLTLPSTIGVWLVTASAVMADTSATQALYTVKIQDGSNNLITGILVEGPPVANQRQGATVTGIVTNPSSAYVSIAVTDTNGGTGSFSSLSALGSITSSIIAIRIG